MFSKAERTLQKRLEEEGLTPHQAVNVVSELVASSPSLQEDTEIEPGFWPRVWSTTVQYLEAHIPFHWRLSYFRGLAAV